MAAAAVLFVDGAALSGPGDPRQPDALYKLRVSSVRVKELEFCL